MLDNPPFVLKTIVGNVCFLHTPVATQSCASGTFNMHEAVHLGTHVALPNPSDAFKDLPIVIPFH